MKNPFRLPEDLSAEARNAFGAVLLFLGGDLVVLAYSIFQAIRTPAWQFNALVGEAVVLLIATIFALGLIRRGRNELGVWLAFGPFLLVLIGTSALFSGVGLLLMAASITVVSLSAGVSLPGRKINALLITSIVTGIISVLVDLFIQTERISTPGFQRVVVFLISVMVLVLGYTIVRKYRDYSLIAKMVIAFLLAALIPIGFMAYYTVTTNTRHLTEDADDTLHTAAVQTANALDTYFTNNLGLVDTASQLHILREYLFLPAAQRPGSETEAVLYNDLRAIADSDKTYIESVGLMDKNGIDVADTSQGDIGTDKSKHIYVAEPLRTGAIYSTTLISPTTHKFSLYFSAPVHDENGRVIGVLRIRYNAAVLQQILTRAAGNVNLLDGSAALLDENLIFMAHSTQQQAILKSVMPFAPDKFAQLQAEGHLPAGQTAEELSLNLSEFEEGLKNVDNQTSFVAETFDKEASVDQGAEEVAVVRMETQPWFIAFAQPQTTYLAPVTELSRTYILYNIFIAMLIAAGAVIVARTISNPVIKLTDVAQQIAAGDMSARIPVTSQDEIGTLADAFNKMTSQLQNTFVELDRRTKDHATVAEVGTATATIMQPQRLLQEVVELTKERFNLYHSHIYLLDEEGENLILTAGAGEPGRIMAAEKRSIPLNREQSLVARAARERKGITVNDVTQAPDFLPNPLLPNTRSELAVPMIVSGNLLGVFDVQSDRVGRFTDADIDIQITLAAQVATSIQNARSYERFKEHADLESLVNTIGQKIQRATTVEDTLQTAVREIGLALGAARVSANLHASHIDDKTNVN